MADNVLAGILRRAKEPIAYGPQPDAYLLFARSHDITRFQAKALLLGYFYCVHTFGRDEQLNDYWKERM